MTTQVPRTTDTLAVMIVEMDKRFNVRMDERDRRLDERFAAQQMSVDRASEGLKAWQASANEWRGALSDLSSRMLTRDEYDRVNYGLIEKIDAQFNSLSQRIDTISGRILLTEGKSSGISSSLTTILIIVGLLISLLGFSTVHSFTSHG
jgi:hypothetical protein